MTKEGRLARGKENFDKGKFLNNSETIAYKATMKPEKAKEEKPKEEKPKEAKNAPSTK